MPDQITIATGTGKDVVIQGDGVGTAADPFILAVSGAPGGEATIADGADVAQGATDDAAATAGGEGTLSAKLRTISASLGALDAAAETDPSQSASIVALLKGILTILADVWDAELHTIQTSAISP